MTIGQKIKEARLKQRLTQTDLCSGYITRNMLSAIENDKATPSIDTLRGISIALGLPLAYFLSEENDLPFFLKKERMPAIKRALETRNYNACVSLITKLEVLDDELNYILALCFFELGTQLTKNGSLESAEKYLSLCLDYCPKTMYDTKRFEAIAPLYLAIAKNVSSPLLEFDDKGYVEEFGKSMEYEFYKYLIQDFDFEYTHYQLKTHVKAKALIRERHYQEAVDLLLEIDDSKQSFEYNSYIIFSVYADLELCYKQLYQFENAYRYSAKRLSLMEGFNQ